jgi:hypothetical protein
MARYIRRNVRIAAQLLLPLLAVAWLTAAAAPCVGPVAGGDDTHDAGAGGADHPFHASPSAQAGEHHGSCPHCPSGGGEEHGPSSATHGSCADADLTRDDRGNVPVKWDVKYFLPVVSRGFSTSSVVPNAVHSASPAGHPPSARVPLNVRYCVYLI